MGARIPPKSVFDVERERTRREAQQALTRGSEALKRRQAQFGGGPSGAFLKQEQLLRQDVAAERGRQFQAIGAAEAAQKEREAESERLRQFAREERLGGESFAAEQARTAREQQERQFGRQFGLAERQAAFQEEVGRADIGLKTRAADLQEQLGIRQMSLAEAQQALDEKVKTGQLDIAQAEIALKGKQVEQQNEQFLATLAQQRIMDSAKIEQMRATADLANREFEFNVGQKEVENVLNASTNFINLYNNMINSGKLSEAEINSVLNRWGFRIGDAGQLIAGGISKEELADMDFREREERQAAAAAQQRAVTAALSTPRLAGRGRV
jgi:hypothetical protein